MSRILHTLAATAIATLAVLPAAAMDEKLDNGDGGEGAQIYGAQLGIKPPLVPGVCPNVATAIAWVHTNYPGKVNIMIARQGGPVAGPISVTLHKGAGGRYLATYNTQIQITETMDTAYRVLVGGGKGVMSNWVPLKYTCIIG